MSSTRGDKNRSAIVRTALPSVSGSSSGVAKNVLGTGLIRNDGEQNAFAEDLMPKRSRLHATYGWRFIASRSGQAAKDALGDYARCASVKNGMMY